ILGFTSIALDDTTLTERARAGLEEVIRASERAAKLTAQLPSLRRKQVLVPKVADVATILSDMRPTLTRLVGEQIELTLSPSHTPARIDADPNQLEQVLMNLVLNARDAIKEVGHVTVDVRSEEVTEPNHNPELNISTGRYVVIEVTDTGEGMDEETQEHIFEPFFTTKPKGSGTGLGLSTVFGIVKQSGGHIRVASEVGRGTTF